MAKRSSGKSEGVEVSRRRHPEEYPGNPNEAGLFVPDQSERHDTQPEANESGQEYYLFALESFYEPKVGIPVGDACHALQLALNVKPFTSKAEVLRYARTAAAGKYVVVKVVDEMEVESPQRENIVRTNPRLKRPRGGE